MLYGYMLENNSKYLYIDNNPLIKLLKESEMDADNIFIDSIMDVNRPELKKLIAILKEKDILIVRSIADLCDSTDNLSTILNYLNERRVTVISAKEYYYTYKSYYQALVDFSGYPKYWQEQKRIRGIELAIEENRMGRKKDSEKIQQALKLYDSDFSVHEISKIINFSKSSIYRALKSRNYKSL